MKRSILFLLILFAVAGHAKDIVIERPAFHSLMKDYNYGGDIYPVKVELKKQETVVHFHIACASWRGWRMTGGRLEVNGRQFAFQKGRILTHDGVQVLADNALEMGKDYEKNAQRDSLILYFDPLPKGTKMFDFVEGNDPKSWAIYGIRLDGKLYPELLPAPKPREDDDKPLEPLTLTYGEATVTATAVGDTICQFSWFGDPCRDPITSNYRAQSHS